MAADWIVPMNDFIGDFDGGDGCGDMLGQRGDLKNRIYVYQVRLAKLAHAEALRKDCLAAMHDRHRHAGYATAFQYFVYGCRQSRNGFFQTTIYESYGKIVRASGRERVCQYV